MKAIWEQTLKIRAYDVDFSNRLKASALFHYMQEVASVHAEDLNVGYNELLHAGLFWVLSWIKIELAEYPQFGDVVHVSTWPKCKYKLYSMRDFLFFHETGETFCRATTAWLLIDAKSKRVTSLKKLPLEVPYQKDKSALAAFPEKLSATRAMEIVSHKQSYYTDIDVNQHVNNARYVEYLLDCYPQEFHREQHINTLTIAFLSEMKYGEQLEIKRDTHFTKEEGHFVEALNTTNGKPVFQALIEWIPR